jgi:hypothetical protein
MDTKTARIRALNDQLRQHLTGGTAVITPGIAALGPKAVERIVKTIGVFDDFCHANDPHEEHDFGAFDVDGHTIMFKIDYLRPKPVDALARSGRSLCHPAGHHDHAGGGVLTRAKFGDPGLLKQMGSASHGSCRARSSPANTKNSSLRVLLKRTKK